MQAAIVSLFVFGEFSAFGVSQCMRGQNDRCGKEAQGRHVLDLQAGFLFTAGWHESIWYTWATHVLGSVQVLARSPAMLLIYLCTCSLLGPISTVPDCQSRIPAVGITWTLHPRRLKGLAWSLRNTSMATVLKAASQRAPSGIERTNETRQAAFPRPNPTHPPLSTPHRLQRSGLGGTRSACIYPGCPGRHLQSMVDAGPILAGSDQLVLGDASEAFAV